MMRGVKVGWPFVHAVLMRSKNTRAKMTGVKVQGMIEEYSSMWTLATG